MDLTLGGAPRRKRPWARIAIAALVAAALIRISLELRVGSTPQLELRSALPAVGEGTRVTLAISKTTRGVSRVVVRAVQEDREAVLLERDSAVLPVQALFSEASSSTVGFVVGTRTFSGLTEGEVRVIAEVWPAQTLLRSAEPERAELKLPVLLRPPRLARGPGKVFVAQGGAEVVRYTVEPRAVAHGVKVGKLEFPGQPLPGAAGEQVAFFAVPWDREDPSDIRLFARDVVGNETLVPFIDRFERKPPSRDVIRVSDQFMGIVVPRIMAREPALEDRGSLVENYVQINDELRERLDVELRALGKESSAEILWSGAFVQMPAKVVSSFADARTYMHEGKEIDRQVHLGFDLASVARDRVPAANTGQVVLAKWFGIYGNTVVVDHGLGLMSLYAHLSQIEVSVGERVERGQQLGRTGATGLALGDHLHFTTLIRGIPVNPLEWWDASWINNRVASKIPALEVN